MCLCRLHTATAIASDVTWPLDASASIEVQLRPAVLASSRAKPSACGAFSHARCAGGWESSRILLNPVHGTATDRRSCMSMCRWPCTRCGWPAARFHLTTRHHDRACNLAIPNARSARCSRDLTSMGFRSHSQRDAHSAGRMAGSAHSSHLEANGSARGPRRGRAPFSCCCLAKSGPMSSRAPRRDQRQA